MSRQLRGTVLLFLFLSFASLNYAHESSQHGVSSENEAENLAVEEGTEKLRENPSKNGPVTSSPPPPPPPPPTPTPSPKVSAPSPSPADGQVNLLEKVGQERSHHLPEDEEEEEEEKEGPVTSPPLPPQATSPTDGPDTSPSPSSPKGQEVQGIGEQRSLPLEEDEEEEKEGHTTKTATNSTPAPSTSSASSPTVPETSTALSTTVQVTSATSSTPDQKTPTATSTTAPTTSGTSATPAATSTTVPATPTTATPTTVSTASGATSTPTGSSTPAATSKIVSTTESMEPRKFTGFTQVTIPPSLPSSSEPSDGVDNNVIVIQNRDGSEVSENQTTNSPTSSSSLSPDPSTQDQSTPVPSTSPAHSSSSKATTTPNPVKSIHDDRKQFLATLQDRDGADRNSTRLRNGIGCNYGDWSEWSKCSSSCGPGEKTRSRDRVSSPQSLPNDMCAPNLTETAPCQTDESCTTTIGPCVYSEWGDWGTCSKACDEGNRTRERTVIGNCIPDPEKNLTETKPCTIKPCIPACKYAEWSDFGPCSVSCGAGTRSRSQTLYVVGDEDVSECTPVQTQVSTCVRSPCNEEAAKGEFKSDGTECEYEEWSPWSPCSKTCGVIDNFRSRFRDELSGSGTECLNRLQFEQCHSAHCPTNNTFCEGLADGSYRNPMEPCSSRILMCSGDNALFLNCPIGLFFDQSRNECDKKDTVTDCAPPPMGQATRLQGSALHYPNNPVLPPKVARAVYHQYVYDQNGENKTDDQKGSRSVHGSTLLRVGSLMAMVTTVLLMVACMTRVILWDVDCC